MALARFEKLPPERRQRLIAAAAEEFAARGFKGAGLGAIAESSGMGKASFYYYFADKADLCRTVLDAAWERLSAGARVDLGSLTAASFWPTFESVMRQNLAACAREPWLLAASKLLNRASAESWGAEVAQDFRERRRAWELSFIRRGQELGVIRADVPVDLLAAISLSARQASNLWMLDRVETLSIEETETLAQHALEIYRALLSPPQAA